MSLRCRSSLWLRWLATSVDSDLTRPGDAQVRLELDGLHHGRAGLPPEVDVPVLFWSQYGNRYDWRAAAPAIPLIFSRRHKGCL